MIATTVANTCRVATRAQGVGLAQIPAPEISAYGSPCVSLVRMITSQGQATLQAPQVGNHELIGVGLLKVNGVRDVFLSDLI